METLLLVLVAVILAETTYLTLRSLRSSGLANKGDILLDTSVLIDGRILSFARSGLISSRLLVARSVVRELQFMADKADHDKRERARFGLEIIEKLQQLPEIDVEVFDDGITSQHGVDEQLILLAQKTGAKLCTIDYNLNKAARVQSVEIININELAHALRVVHLPGEKLDVELVQPGQDKKQGVGYLDDGTMVVVDDSRDFIGKTVNVELTRVLQTAAGRMVFAKRTQAKQLARPEKAREPAVAVTSRKVEQKKTPLRPRQKQPQATEPTDTKEQKPRSNQRRGYGRRSRPKTAEDTLVDLANK